MKQILLIALAVSAAACERRDPVADDANQAAALPAPADLNAGNPSGAAPPADSAASPAPAATDDAAPAATIPAFLHGRWGLTPGDCTSTLGDNKGLLTISPSDLKFYESRAVPVSNTQSSNDSFSADFVFTGEGMTWTKYQTFKRSGDKLVRTEGKPMASFTYAKCT